MPAQLRRRAGEIASPTEAQEGDYDLVVVGSPTWWLTTNMPIRSFEVACRKAILAGKPFAAASISRRYYKGNLKDVKKLVRRTAERGSTRRTSSLPAAR